VKSQPEHQFPHLVAKFILWVMPSCREMTRLTSQKLDGAPIPFGLRVRMALHLTLCRWCRAYRTQLLFLHRVLRKHSDRFAEIPRTAEQLAGFRQKLRTCLIDEPPSKGDASDSD
jgi:predicted anti-sigma-YlaC factor YlaD